MRMLMNNLDEKWRSGRGSRGLWRHGEAARSWECLSRDRRSLRTLENDETLLVQSGKPVGVFQTHEYAPRVLICNSNLVGHWSNWESSTSWNAPA